MEKENLVNMVELCKYLKTTKPTVLKMISEGLPFRKLSNDYRFKVSEVDGYTKREVNQIAKIEKNNPNNPNNLVGYLVTQDNPE